MAGEGLKPQYIEYLKAKTVLILDDQQGSRILMKQFFLDLGVPPDRLLATKNYHDALAFLDKRKPEVILCEYEVGGHFGIEFADLQVEHYPNPLERIFLIVSHRTDMSSVADAAEEQIDGFLIKPASEALLEKYLSAALDRKHDPPEYAKILVRARRHIELGEFEQADQELMLASVMTSNPYIENYLQGVIAEKQERLQDALAQYDKSLKANGNFFKCLSAKFVLQVKLNRYNEAYVTLLELRKKFPVTPEILKNAMITVVLTYRFLEVDEYFEFYRNLRRKSNDLKFVVSMSFLTAGKMLLREGKVKDALLYFKKGAIISSRQTEFLEDIITNLIRAHQLSACNEYFQMFSADDISQSVIRCMRYRLLEKEGRPVDELILEAKKLVFEGDADEYVCKAALILAKSKGNEILTDSVLNKACQLLPEQAGKFRTLANAS